MSDGDNMVERVARALCEDCGLNWETAIHDGWRRQARAAIVKASSLMAVKPLPALAYPATLYELYDPAESIRAAMAASEVLDKMVGRISPTDTPFMRLLAQRSTMGDCS